MNITNKLNKKWSNKTNQSCFYENKEIVSILKQQAIVAGLDKAEDIACIYDKYVKRDSNILEVGGGYGRVVENLMARCHLGDIYVLEKSRVLLDNLYKKFKNKLLLLPSGILELEVEKYKFDVVLSMWSGISDFPKEQQGKFVQKLSSLLSNKGKIIMDTSIYNRKPLNAEVSLAQNYLISISEDCEVCGYIPSPTEMHAYASAAGLNCIFSLQYKNYKARERLIYVFEKNI